MRRPSAWPRAGQERIDPVRRPACPLEKQVMSRVLEFEHCTARDLQPESSLFAALSYGHPAPGTATAAVKTRPVRACSASAILGKPSHSAANMYSVFRCGPPNAQAKQPRSSSIVCNTSPPSRTRTQRLLGTSAYQMAFSTSMQMPSGTPSRRSAHTRRFVRLPSASMSKAVSRFPWDSATIFTQPAQSKGRSSRS
jgi:hypothetical protein